MEVLGWIFLILIGLSIVGWYKQKKREEALATVLAAGAVLFVDEANKRLPDHVKNQTTPIWYKTSTPDEDQEFLTRVRALVSTDGIPLPQTSGGNNLFNLAALIAASAMEAAGGSISMQGAYAGIVIKAISQSKGKYCFDRMSSVSEFDI